MTKDLNNYENIKLSLSEDKKHVLTSHGYSVPLADAISLYKIALEQKAKKQPIKYEIQDLRVGSFAVNSITRHGSLSVALTSVKFSEMKRFYNKLVKQNIISLIK